MLYSADDPYALFKLDESTPSSLLECQPHHASGIFMLFVARFLAGSLFIFFIAGFLGTFLGENANFAAGIQLAPFAVPLAYFSWLVWRTLKPVDVGMLKFCLAHLAPGSLILIGLIFLFAPNKIGGFMLAGVGLVLSAIVLIHQMHLQRRIIKSTSLPANSSNNVEAI